MWDRRYVIHQVCCDSPKIQCTSVSSVFYLFLSSFCKYENKIQNIIMQLEWEFSVTKGRAFYLWNHDVTSHTTLEALSSNMPHCAGHHFQSFFWWCKLWKTTETVPSKFHVQSSLLLWRIKTLSPQIKWSFCIFVFIFC